MTEEVVIEGADVVVPEVETVKEQPGARVSAVAQEAEKLAKTVAKAVLVTAQELTNVMVVRLDAEMRHDMGILIQSGAARNRHEALEYLLKEGIKAKRPLFEKIEQTQARVVALREQLRTMRTVQLG